MRPLLILLLALGAALHLSAQEPARQASRFGFRLSPIVDLWYELRTLAEGESLASEEAGALRAAIEAARALDEVLGSPIAWGLVEGRIAGCATGDELLQAMLMLPPEFQLRGPDGARRSIPLRAQAQALAEQVVQLEETWLRESWPQRKVLLEKQRAHLDELLADGKETAIWARIEELLGLAPPDTPVPVQLVVRSPWPGAVTHRAPGGAACFVAVESRRGAALAEVVVHEALHAVEVMQPEGATCLFDAQREAFRKAQLSPRDRRTRDALHAYVFLAAAEAVRTALDPEHVDYGITAGVYERMGAPAGIVRAAWTSYVQGQLDADALVARVAEGLARSGGED